MPDTVKSFSSDVKHREKLQSLASTKFYRRHEPFIHVFFLLFALLRKQGWVGGLVVSCKNRTLEPVSG